MSASRNLRFLAGLLCAISLLRPGPARAEGPARLCLVQAAAIPGLDPAELNPALAVEARKSGVPLVVIQAQARLGCSPGDAALVVDFQAPVLLLSGETLVLDLRDVDRADRAQDLARRVVLALAPGSPPTLGIERPAVATSGPQRTVRPAGLSGYLLAGGRYAREAGMNVGGVDLEGGVSWLNERLTLGLAAGWQPGLAIPGSPVPATVQSVGLAVALRGGWEFRPVLLRLGVLAGLDLRRLAVEPPTRLSASSWWMTAPTLAGEAEVLFRVGNWLVGVAATVRGFGAWTDARWDGSTFYSGPRIAGGVALRVGGILPGRRP